MGYWKPKEKVMDFEMDFVNWMDSGKEIEKVIEN